MYTFSRTDVQGFSLETEMVETYTLAQAKNPLRSVLAVVFERYNEETIEYKIRHSWNIPNTLYQNALDDHMSASPTIYFLFMPFVQVQICVDEALINQTVPGSMSNIKV